MGSMANLNDGVNDDGLFMSVSASYASTTDNDGSNGYTQP